MNRKTRTSAVLALCCTVAGAGLVGCEDSSSDSDAKPSTSATAQKGEGALPDGAQKLDVGGSSVNVSCSGPAADGAPVVVLMHGGGDSVKKMAGFQKTLSKKNRVCSYDRLGAGASDKPAGPQTVESSGKVLTAVLEQVAADAPVVLAGHSLGGLLAARYAPDHQDKVKGLVLMDATSPTQSADVTREVPETATGPAGDLRKQFLAIAAGNNPEKLVIKDGEVRSAGDIPVEVIQHGEKYLEAVPEHGPGLERAWSEGQRKWLAISSRSKLSTAAKSGHHIYLDRPDVAAKATQRVVARATA
ncbi:alpha/beta fold hydrolase [Streptomyces armeniacus]|uniref:Alpha/beta fold hydrolase n=1 Tax=Streptomyces armeniacus TaxID=83291 RepID=A0A345XM58_9ACTN|nr:alpha/beta fold hydrolase [Streptomyces armeniacus]AXK32724.1 alpha/beta fold hydrolase [Streptomyces armeniacus]